jgi:hypothetical protein
MVVRTGKVFSFTNDDRRVKSLAGLRKHDMPCCIYGPFDCRSIAVLLVPDTGLVSATRMTIITANPPTRLKGRVI